jgi:type I restriction enzyme, S subunit
VNRTWTQTTLGNLLKVEHGFAFKGEYFSESGNYVLLTPGNFYEEGGFKLRPGKDRFYLGEIPERYILPKGAMLIAMTEQAEGLLGSPAIMPESNRFLHNQRLGRVVPKTKSADVNFLYYLFKTNVVRQQVRNSSSGAKVRHTSPERIYRVMVTVPQLPTQRKIANILTAYDDLIETNQRRIALLEKMAEEIYREWFIRMRFPGYRSTKFVKGVPDAWEVRELSDCADINPSSLGKNDRPDFIHYVDIGSVTTNQIEDVQAIPRSEAPGRAKRHVRHGDIIWSSVRPANRAYCLIYEPAEHTIVSTGFAVIRPKPETPFTFLNFAVTSNGFVDQMAAVARGAAYPATSFDDFEKAKLLWPGTDLLQDFHKICDPLFRQKHTLTQQSRILTRTRDLLLPRLISGKLSVADLDIQFPPSMREGEEEAERKALDSTSEPGQVHRL